MDDDDIGGRIRAAREARDISQSELAKQLRVEQSHVWKWEKNHRVPRLRTLVVIGEILGVSLDYLARGIEQNSGLQRKGQ